MNKDNYKKPEIKGRIMDTKGGRGWVIGETVDWGGDGRLEGDRVSPASPLDNWTRH